MCPLSQILFYQLNTLADRHIVHSHEPPPFPKPNPSLAPLRLHMHPEMTLKQASTSQLKNTSGSTMVKALQMQPSSEYNRTNRKGISMVKGAEKKHERDGANEETVAVSDESPKGW